MTNEKRWMKPMIAEAAACKVKMPWERGLRRQASIARRATAAPAQLQLKTHQGFKSATA